MTTENQQRLIATLRQHQQLGISQQIDFDKFYLYSIIAHSTAIEGSTVSELESQLLFDEGITAKGKPLIDQLMNLDLKAAYDYGIAWIKHHHDITVEWLISLSAKVMARTGSEPMNYLKVPTRLEAFCEQLNRRRKAVDPSDAVAVYELSFWAHYELVTIHPWVDGNGRTARLLMNLLQIEHNLLPVKVLKEDKLDYIQALIDTRETHDINIFTDFMTRLHTDHLRHDITRFEASMQ